MSNLNTEFEVWDRIDEASYVLDTQAIPEIIDMLSEPIQPLLPADTGAVEARIFNQIAWVPHGQKFVSIQFLNDDSLYIVIGQYDTEEQARMTDQGVINKRLRTERYVCIVRFRSDPECDSSR